MSEELLQRDLLKNPARIGKWDFYNIGATSIKALKEYGIIRNIDYKGVEKKKIDALIVLRKSVIAVIEYKSITEFKTKQQQDKAIEQEREVARAIGSKLIIATDTKETVWVNAITGKRIKDENGIELRINFDPTDEKIHGLIEKINFSINEKNNQLKPKKLVNPTDLAKQIWQDIWSVSGATPENCLYTFVELFIFKYLSDLEVLKGSHNFYTLLDTYKTNTDDDVLEFYVDSIRKKIKELFPYNRNDNTTIINGTIFVSKDQKSVAGYSTVFKKVLTKFNDYGKLEHIDFDFKSQLFESFLKESISKKNWGQFFTPIKVVRAIVEMSKDDIKSGIKICDPACGVGKFLLEPIITRLDEFYEISKGSLKEKITIHGFDKGFDKDEQKTIILAKANMLIYFSDLIKENIGITEQFSDLFNRSFTLKTNSILGTLSSPVENEYDLILTNPPYVTSGSSNLKEEISKDGELKPYYKINALGVEGLFMEWIIRALKPNGKAFIVIPDGILNRQNDKHLRKFILDECIIDGLISLPLNTFFTTNKKTYILSITKKINKKETQKTPVFTYLCSEIGETRDIYRFDIDQDDLKEAVTLFSFFKGNKLSFEKINTDKRCKLISYNYFRDNIEHNWVIDKQWNEEEKIELGIIKKNESVTLFEFSSIIEEVATTIKGFQEEVKELAEKKKSKITFNTFKLNELFFIKKGISKYTKKYGDQNKGDFPVYSASNREALTSINSFDYDGEYLTWATNGFAGYMMLINGKFSINADRGLLQPKKENINLLYVKNILEPKLRVLAKGRKGERGEAEFTKVYSSMIENIELEFPITNDGKFDSKNQDRIVEQILLIEDIKRRIADYKIEINELEISVTDSYIYKSYKISEIFNFQDGFAFPSSIYTTKHDDIKLIRIQDINNKSEPKTIRIPKDYKFPNQYKYLVKKGDYLLSLSGAAGFNLIKWDGEQGFLNQRITKITKKETFKNFFIEGYEEALISQVHKELNSLGKGANNNLTRKDIIEIKVKIPVTPKNEIDLSIQKHILDSMYKIEEIKKNILDELEKIILLEIDFY